MLLKVTKVAPLGVMISHFVAEGIFTCQLRMMPVTERRASALPQDRKLRPVVDVSKRPFAPLLAECLIRGRSFQCAGRMCLLRKNIPNRQGRAAGAETEVLYPVEHVACDQGALLRLAAGKLQHQAQLRERNAVHAPSAELFDQQHLNGKSRTAAFTSTSSIINSFATFIVTTTLLLLVVVLVSCSPVKGFRSR